MTTQLEQAWELAKQRFAAVGIDVEEALRQLDRLPVSMHCWQGDDVSGFENPEGSLTGGIQATGNYPGKARNASELRADLEQAMRLIPGPKRLNLHAIYLESDTPVSRDQIKPEHFKNWVEWAKANQLGLDFNPSCFSHPLSADGFTLSHADDSIRQFWIDHCKASRRVSAYFGEQLGTPSVMNIWIPDGMKDITVDRLAPRQRLLAALDEVISEKLDPAHHIDAVESKLFGIGAESYTVGSNEFYMGYATSRQTALCLDAGHFHPTEVISDKISAAMLYVPQLLLHVSRPVRWDSDHVVLLDDETQAIASEIVRHDLFDRVHIGLDFFDASINRIAAWVIGTRNMKKALLRALLEPTAELRKLEAAGDYSARLALLEEQKSLPWQAVWEMYCQRHDTPAGSEWLKGWDERNGGNLTLRLDDADIAPYHDNFHAQPRYIPLSQPMPLLANTPFIVTGSGKFFRNVQLDPAANLGVVKVDSDGAGYHILWGLTHEAVPTSELPAHFLSHCERIKATNGKDRVIMHCHATNLIALTYVLENDTAVFTRQLWEGSTECLVVFPDGVGILPWMVPGTDEIGQATAQEMQKHSLVLWPFHGVFGSGPTLDETFGLIDTAEKSAQVLVKVYSMGGMKQTISREELIALGQRFGVTPLASALAL